MISSSMLLSSDPMFSYMIEADWSQLEIMTEVPDLDEVFLKDMPSKDYPAWDILLDGIPMPLLDRLDVSDDSLE